MISDELWKYLRYLKRSDFNYPDDLNFSIVQAVDRFIELYILVKPEFLSDFRPNDLDSQHSRGLALDMTWPGLDPVDIWNKARSARLFTGLGIYVNPAGFVSFHFDRRIDRTVEDPALWGQLIDPETDPRREKYVAAGVVIDVIKKKEILTAGLVLGLLYWLSRQNQKT